MLCHYISAEKFLLLVYLDIKPDIRAIDIY